MTPTSDSGKRLTHYDHSAIEKKWQKHWDEAKLYKVEDNVAGKDNFYTLVEFTYPSGDLHVGHWYAFAVPDIFARYKRMRGFNVLYPMGFDAFGLPAENAAIKRGLDPKALTYQQMETMRTQFGSMGAMFDWEREVVSCAPEYYKWTQWMFNQFLKHDLVYRANTKVNWCPKDKTVLANEQVLDGKCERCSSDVMQRDQDQWMLRITKYADRLIDDLDALDWPHAIKEAQKNWIGRSEGSVITFSLQVSDTILKSSSLDTMVSPDIENSIKNPHSVDVFTTRADTLFGVTYIVLAPEHPLLAALKNAVENIKEIEAYVAVSKKKSELDRQQSKEKTGVELKGICATNPATGEVVPVWIADYVLAGYGTGAVMAVPAHDERDFEFAQKYNLPIKEVISKHIVLEDKYTERIDTNTIYKTAVSAIIRDKNNNFYLTKENNESQRIGLVGGCLEDGEDVLEALRREIIEETGFTDFEIKRKISPEISVWGYRYTKKVNQRSSGPAYEVILNSLVRISSEVDQGDHDLITVTKEKVLSVITSPQHKYLFERYLNDSLLFTEQGVLVHSEDFDGLSSDKAKKKITEFVGGKTIKSYRLRDWGISRQRYWGTPIPIVYDPQGNPHPVPDEHLPWTLPTDVDHTPDGTAPLARSAELFKRTEKLFGVGWKPEVETMDTFVDSTWYFYRYLDNKNDSSFAGEEKRASWMPIDLYMGGAEHTTMHLLYSRFWVKALHDLGFVKEQESFIVRRNRGIILGPDGNKMSKSKGNVINPDEIVERLGADTVRMYLAFIGPYGVTGNYPWDPNGVVGVRRFLERVWKLQSKIGNGQPTPLLHKTIKKVSDDIEEYKFNTCIASMMILLNTWEKEAFVLEEEYITFIELLAPFAPHAAEELYSYYRSTSVHLASWPIYNEALLIDDMITIGVQINGKLRGEMTVEHDETKESIEARACTLPTIVPYIQQGVKKIIVVPSRIVNIVV